MKTLVINSSNYVAGSGNTFIYKFPTAVSFAKGDRVAMANVAMTNSTFNISAARGNNTVSTVWNRFGKTNQQGLPQFITGSQAVKWASLPTIVTFYIPDGFYTIPQLNTYLQLQMFNMGMYMTKDNGANIIYFFSFTAIPSQYCVQLEAYVVPNLDDKPTAWSLPSSTDLIPTNPVPGLTGSLAGTTYARAGSRKDWWCMDFGLPPRSENLNTIPALLLPASFCSLLGLTATTFGFVNGIQQPSFAWNNGVQLTYSASPTLFVSTTAPQIAPVNSYIMTCSLLNNPYAVPINVFYSIPLSVSIGTMMSIYPSQHIWNDIAPNNYNQIVIQFFDQVFNPIQLQDPNIVLTLVILGEGEEG